MNDDEQVGVWLNESRALLATARGDDKRIENALVKLSLTAFRQLRFSPMIVWDYLTISTPGLFGEAGYSDAEVDSLMPVIERAIIEASRRSAAE